MMDLNLTIEIVSFIFNILYLAFISFQKPIGWIFGIIGSALAIYLFLVSKLYSESILYFYYVIAGIYGYWYWKKTIKSAQERTVVEYSLKQHALIILIGFALSFLLGSITGKFGASMPFFDATTTIFSFIATWLATRKVLSNWIYWIVIDLASIYLYATRDFNFFMVQMIIYSGAACFGFWQWRKYPKVIKQN